MKANRTKRLPDHYYNPKVCLLGNMNRARLTNEELIRIPMSKSAYVLLVSLAKWDRSGSRGKTGQYSEAHERLKSSSNSAWHAYYQVSSILKHLRCLIIMCRPWSRNSLQSKLREKRLQANFTHTGVGCTVATC